MNTIQIYESIVKYRENAKGVSTSHTMSCSQFWVMGQILLDKFGSLSVELDGLKAKVTIPSYRTIKPLPPNDCKYSLTSLNLGGLGGPMGSERIVTNFVEYFTTLQKAKQRAEEDYGNKINWVKLDNGRKHSSGDLEYVEYTIVYFGHKK